MAHTIVRVSDEAIGELIARQGGYEEVEKAGRWARIANSLGLRKDQAQAVKARYEDMLRASAELDEHEEEEEEEYEVESILDSRTDDKGNTEYLVKWKDSMGDEDGDRDNMTWEPREHLACPELLQQFEEKQRRLRDGDDAADPATEATAADATALSSTDADPAVSAAGEAPEGVSLKRKVEELGDGEPSADASSKLHAGLGGATDGVSSYDRVMRVRRPTEAGQPLYFEVALTDGSSVLLSNEKLRAEAPLLLLDFYEERLDFAP